MTVPSTEFTPLVNNFRGLIDLAAGEVGPVNTQIEIDV